MLALDLLSQHALQQELDIMEKTSLGFINGIELLVEMYGPAKLQVILV